MQLTILKSSAVQLILACLCVAVVAGIISDPKPAEANTDPSCIAKEQEAGPCKDMPYGPTYYVKNGKCSTTGPGQTKPGYIGAPCKENDGTAFKVGGKCVPGAQCKCEDCKADGDKGGMPPMLPMLPMMMPMMDMPMMPMQPCVATPRTVTTASSTETAPLIRTVTVNGVTTTSTTTRSTSTPVTRTVTDPDCTCRDNPSAPGCQAAGSSGLLNSFGGSGSVFQNTALGALDRLGSVANTVGSSLINSAANAIESVTGLDINTDFTRDTGPTAVQVTPIGATTNTQYAQSTYTPAATADPSRPQYAYDSDTTQYGAFSGQEQDPSVIEQWTRAVSSVLTQLGQALSSLFGIL